MLLQDLQCFQLSQASGLPAEPGGTGFLHIWWDRHLATDQREALLIVLFGLKLKHQREKEREKKNRNRTEKKKKKTGWQIQLTCHLSFTANTLVCPGTVIITRSIVDHPVLWHMQTGDSWFTFTKWLWLMHIQSLSLYLSSCRPNWLTFFVAMLAGFQMCGNCCLSTTD